VSRVHAFTATVIVWHGTTAALPILASLALGPLVLAGRRATDRS
jgi:hypothetical protein